MRDRIERAFERWGRFAYRNAGAVIAAVLALTAGAATQLPKLGFDTSTEGFFHEDDPSLLAYEEFRTRFGMDTLILVAVRPPEVFELGFLEKLRAFHEELEAEVPMLREVTSLVNARDTRGEDDRLVVGELMEEWPASAADVARIEQRARANVFYRDQLISSDGKLTTVVLEPVAYAGGNEDSGFEGFDDAVPDPAEEAQLLSGDQLREIVEATYAVMERHRAPDFALYASGSPVMTTDLQREMSSDMRTFTLVAMAAIAVLLGAAFRRTAAVVLPLVAVVLALVQTLSLMAWLGIPIKAPTQILPSFLLAVGVGAAVHILAIFYQSRRRGEDKQTAIAFSLGHSGLAVAMTSLTTAGGLLSFTVAELAPIAEFGVMAPIGVMVSLMVNVVLLPAMIAVFPMREEQRLEGEHPTLSQRLAVAAGRFATRNAAAVVGVWAAVLVAAVLLAGQVRLSHAPFEWFPVGHPTRDAADLLNAELNGSLFVELLVDTGREDGVKNPALLQGLEALGANIAGLRSGGLFVGKSTSVADVVRETHQALNENRPEFYVVPDDARLVAQELLLFENSGSDDLEDLVDPQFTTARFTIKMPFLDAVQFGPFFEKIMAEANERFAGLARVEMTGLGYLAGETIGAVVTTLARSYAIALTIIAPLLVLLIGNLRLGAAAIIPNLAPIVFILGVMGAFDIPLDSFTLMIGSIALGLAVDDTIHFMHNFRRYFSHHGDVERAVEETLATTGQALLLTTLVLASGFFVYTFATMTVLHNFGMLTALTIVVALLADILLAPALMVLISRQRTLHASLATEDSR